MSLAFIFTVGVEGPLSCVDLPPASGVDVPPRGVERPPGAVFAHDTRPFPSRQPWRGPRSATQAVARGRGAALLVATFLRFGRPGILLVNSRGFDQTTLLIYCATLFALFFCESRPEFYRVSVFSVMLLGGMGPTCRAALTRGAARGGVRRSSPQHTSQHNLRT